MKEIIATVGIFGVMALGGFVATDTDAGQVVAPQGVFTKDIPTDSQAILIPDDATIIKVSLSRENWPEMKDAVKVTSDYFNGKEWRKNDDAYGFTDDGGIAIEKGQERLDSFNESPLPPGTGRQIILHVVAHEDLNSSLNVEFTKPSLVDQLVGALHVKEALAAMGFVQAPATGGNCGATTCTLAFVSNVTAGNLITAECAVGAGGNWGVTDTLGNTYTQAYTKDDTLDSGGNIRGWYTLSSLGGADTVSCNTNSASIRITIQESSWGGSTGTLDQTSLSANGASSASMVVSSFTPASNGSALICSYRNPNSVTFTAGTNYTLRGVAPVAPGSREGSEIWYQTSATADTGPETQSVNQSYAGGCMVFKPAGSAAAATPPRYIFQGGQFIFTGARFIFN